MLKIALNSLSGAARAAFWVIIGEISKQRQAPLSQMKQRPGSLWQDHSCCFQPSVSGSRRSSLTASAALAATAQRLLPLQSCRVSGLDSRAYGQDSSLFLSSLFSPSFTSPKKMQAPHINSQNPNPKKSAGTRNRPKEANTAQYCLIPPLPGAAADRPTPPNTA